jgi:hypothetical protein
MSKLKKDMPSMKKAVDEVRETFSPKHQASKLAMITGVDTAKGTDSSVTSMWMLIPESIKDRIDIAATLLEGISAEQIHSSSMLTSLTTAKRALAQAQRRV